jgi:hypothetical protein
MEKTNADLEREDVVRQTIKKVAEAMNSGEKPDEIEKTIEKLLESAMVESI